MTTNEKLILDKLSLLVEIQQERLAIERERLQLNVYQAA